MPTASSYAVLFEPVPIGPVIAPNRFFQVPHCNGMGHQRPRSLAAMRGIKAEGGWGVVCTEEVEIHPSAELAPHAEGRIWDDGDVAALRLMTEAVHEHGALAGIELVHNGFHAANRGTRLPPMAPQAMPVFGNDPVQARAMTLADICDLRRWYREAALRAREAGFDIVYVYAGHGMTTLMHFMQRRFNQRSDAYGGSLENRVRLTREVLEEVKDAVGDTCAVAFRFAVEEHLGAGGISCDGEGRDIVGMLAEVPDLWDVNVSGWEHDSATARFEPNEGYQDAYTAFVKSMTSKPVVGVGRYTSVDTMVSKVRKGVLDFIGAARPSIADPFMPNKIREGRVEEIRECIGCNICVSGDQFIVPLRCTQNPTMGEEWRRGWHPERIEPRVSDEPVLVVGGGPAGLECALQLGKRGYEVTLAEESRELGGRINLESRLPGMASYARVRDYREGLLRGMANVEIYLDNALDAQSISALEFSHVIVATGSTWRRDGVGRFHRQSIPGLSSLRIDTPDDLMTGDLPEGRVVLFDDDHYFMGGVLAELLAEKGREVTLVTPAPLVSQWTENTLEQRRIQSRLLEAGVNIVANGAVAEAAADRVELACVFTGRRRPFEMDALVLVTARDPRGELLADLAVDSGGHATTGLKTLQAIGDCLAPGTVASAVYLGHLAARCFQGESWDAALFRRERPALSG